jgi:hypothetical protein
MWQVNQRLYPSEMECYHKLSGITLPIAVNGLSNQYCLLLPPLNAQFLVCFARPLISSIFVNLPPERHQNWDKI